MLNGGSATAVNITGTVDDDLDCAFMAVSSGNGEVFNCVEFDVVEVRVSGHQTEQWRKCLTIRRFPFGLFRHHPHRHQKPRLRHPRSLRCQHEHQQPCRLTCQSAHLLTSRPGHPNRPHRSEKDRRHLQPGKDRREHLQEEEKGARAGGK